MPHIEVRDVSLIYDTPSGRVTGIGSASFVMEASEFLCIVGPSGCGKSSLLNIIAGFLKPTGGGSRLSRGPGGGDDRASRHREGRSGGSPTPAARPAERGIPGAPEGAPAPSRQRGRSSVDLPA